MVDFIFEYGMFLAKAVTVIVTVAAILMLIAGFSKKGPQKAGLNIEKLNDKYRDMKHTLQKSVLNKSSWKKQSKEEKKQQKKDAKAEEHESSDKQRVFVLDFKGDIRASGVSHLREEISAVASVATKHDEVVLRLENQGGAVHEHGLAASQLLRLKNRGIPLTVIIDKVAASGGYLMACIADRVIAAPFAVIGSIGVIAQIPNFSRALEDRGVDFEMVTAGKYKRTVTMFGKNTDEDRAKLREELEEVHTLFKDLVAEQRPSLDIEAVATGEHWYGSRARELGLVDELGSSDDYLLQATDRADVFHVEFRGKQSLQERIFSVFESRLEEVTNRAAEFWKRSQFR
jgi:serine protease SohB